MSTKRPRQSNKKPRSTLHLVLAGRKGGRHRPRREKRAAQKLRRDLEGR